MELALNKIGHSLARFSSEDTDDDICTDGSSNRMVEKCLTDSNDYVLIEKQLDGSHVLEERCVSDSELVLEVQGRWPSGSRFYVRQRGFRSPRSPRSPLSKTIWYDSKEDRNANPDYALVQQRSSASGYEVDRRRQGNTYSAVLSPSPVYRLTKVGSYSLPDSLPSQNAADCKLFVHVYSVFVMLCVYGIWVGWPDSDVVKTNIGKQRGDSDFDKQKHRTVRKSTWKYLVRLRKKRKGVSESEAVNESAIHVGRSTFHFSTDFMAENSFSDDQLCSKEVGSDGDNLVTMLEPFVRSRSRSDSLPPMPQTLVEKVDSNVNIRAVRQESSTIARKSDTEMQREINRRSEALARIVNQSSQQSVCLSVSDGDNSSLENLDKVDEDPLSLSVSSTDSSLKHELLMMERQLLIEQRMCNGAMRLAELPTSDRQLLKKRRESVHQSKQYLTQLQNQIALLNAKVQQQDLDCSSQAQ